MSSLYDFQFAQLIIPYPEQTAADFSRMVNEMYDYAGMTQAEVAELLKMSRTTLWRKMEQN